jgi:hypothetical protein
MNIKFETYNEPKVVDLYNTLVECKD